MPRYDRFTTSHMYLKQIKSNKYKSPNDAHNSVMDQICTVCTVKRKQKARYLRKYNIITIENIQYPL